MKKIYFAGSIRGGRNDKEIYRQIIGYLQTIGEVLTEHVGSSALTPSGEENMTDREIFERDLEWLSSSEFVVAEVSTPSLGVGFEIAKALDLGKKIICLYRNQEGKKLSAMISGCPGILVKEYQSLEEAKNIINSFFPAIKRGLKD